MNQKLSQAGRKGGTSGRGQSKVRPLTQERARQMAVKRWGIDKTKAALHTQECESSNPQVITSPQSVEKVDLLSPPGKQNKPE